MNTLNITFATIKTVLCTVPSFYVPQGDGGYTLFVVGDALFIKSQIRGADTADLADFDTNFKSRCVQAASGDDALVLGNSANKVPLVQSRQADGLPEVVIAPTIGAETVIASHNLCDKCTWFGDSVRVTGETLVDHGDGITFDSVNNHWIDAVSGRFYSDDRVSEEQKAANPGDPHGYLVVVKVGGVEKTMREPFEASGGDYEVIWETGQVVFFSAPASAPVVSYSYATTSMFYVRPSPGKMLRILRAEVDVSLGCVMTDTVMYSIFAVVDAVAPGLMPGVPSGTLIPIGEVVYKRMGQISTEAQGAYPSVEVLGASDTELAMGTDEFRRKSRGTKAKVQALPFNYNTSRDLSSAALMEIRVHTKHDRPFEGDTVTVTFYCVSKDEV